MSFIGIFSRSLIWRACVNARYLNTKPIESSRITRPCKINKRSGIKDTSNDGSSITAYNLSEQLQIMNVNKILAGLKEYKVAQLPEDLQGEAVLLRLKNSDDDYNKFALRDEPLNDVFLFQTGSIVFWGVSHEEQRRILQNLSPLSIDPYSNDVVQYEKEYLNYDLKIDDGKSKLVGDKILLATNRASNQVNCDQFAFSHAVALSVKLAIWETMLDEYIDSIRWITNDMKEGKTLKITKKEVLRKIGEIYEMKHRLNLSSDLLDLPDIYWDRPEQEAIYLSLISFLNIKRRTHVMNEKLNNCCELMNLISSHMNDKYHISLETMIIFLIAFEVMIEIFRLL